ncbi:tail assembly protein [Pectobacterium carotovorum subsp. carotovorum]|uniref:tail fiber assembly protein n=1 Tax=Pectobacterium versatile TaxID=2488639 RepID=UPI00102EB443|nr:MULTISPECIES: tail fiber assembly protein [Pectobacterium]MBA0173435.1 tail fiber assembly protein [Pectobacterium versatile]MBQ4772285.1 tail fiber assembly protein [Pectobacterium versatile]MCL6364073.1 tail fiber assembly protein [Pectobacterium carotovorum subsp. carotovorum]QQK71628.1 tail fiber assembly protein [Pectobacterium versatile]TAI95890.1 tail fiber assembly protein [Pectobacterium versatile]
MSNYSTQIKNAELNEHGLAINTGWITVYHVNPTTREYQSASYEYVMQGVGLPADSYADEPQLPPVGQALRRSADGKAWEQVPDHRGQTVYSTETRQAQTVMQFGELPENMTFLAPATEFDQWNGTTWVTSLEAQQLATTKSLQQELAARRATANTQIAELNYAVDLAIATDEEQERLTQWKIYLVTLNRLDLTAAPVMWPVAPSV